MTPAQVCLLGPAHLRLPDGAEVPLERKAAALLASLTLEGPTRRAQLCDLLWPETREAAARNNLVHLLRKLRTVSGTDLVTGAEVLSLAPGVGVDAALERSAFDAGRFEEQLAFRGELLAALTYEDCADLDEWVSVQRERRAGRRAEARRALGDAAEAGGRYEDALAHAQALLERDPLSEDAWRRVMRLHYLRGDRAAALGAYARCREVLRRELGVEPLAQTAELARDIDRGRVPMGPRSAPPEIPLAVLRPPVLVGREREWQLMEEAWSRGQFIFVSGEPGVGKTRLARDFALSRGECNFLEGRPGDSSQPGASSVRSFRTMLRRSPDMPFEDWVRLEMSRYLPELARPGDVLPPLASHTDLARFRQAMGEFARALHVGVASQLLDDWHYFDDLSVEDGMSFLGTSYPLGQPGGLPVILVTFRRGELSQANAQLLEQLVAQNMALHLELQPLSPGAQDALLSQLGVPEDGPARGRLRSYAGGNPLFVLETVRHLIESRGLGAELPARLLPPGRVEQLITRRLARLSPGALQAARAAAALQSDFSLEQVAGVLGAPLLNVAEAWEELEGAQLTRGERFAHDLVYEAVSAGTPGTTRRLLHRSAARTLAGGRAPGAPGIPAARVAHHWQEGGQAAEAAPWLLAAGRASRGALRLLEAAAFFRAAARSAGDGADPPLAFEALRERAVTLGHLADRSAREEAVDELAAAAQTPLQRAQAEALRAELHGAYHEAHEAAGAARRGLSALELAPLSAGTERLRAALEVAHGTALWLQGETLSAADAMARAVAAQEALGESAELGANLSNLGVMFDHLDRHREATICHRRACVLLERHGDASELSGPLHNLAVSLLEQGEARAALVAALRAHELESRTDGDPLGIAVSHSNLGKIHAALGQYAAALRHYDLAERSSFEGEWYGSYFATLRAETWLALGRPDLAAGALSGGHDLAGAPGRIRSRALVTRALVAAAQGEDAAGYFSQAQGALGETPRPLPRAHLDLARARLALPAQALALAGAWLDDPGAADLGGVQLTAHACSAAALLALGRPAQARPSAEAAWELLAALEPEFATRGEVLTVIARVRRALGDPGADGAAALADAWFRETAGHHLPDEARASFAAVWAGGLLAWNDGERLPG